MRLALLVVLTLAIVSGCAGLSEAEREAFRLRVGPTLPADPNGLIKDQRDPASKTTAYLGAGFGYGCNFGVTRYGDLGSAADRVPRLERDLRAAIDPWPSSPVILRKYSIFHNSAYDGLNTHGSIVGALVLTGTMPPGEGQRVRCDREKMEGGWFDKADLTNEFSPITVDIALLFDGEEYAVTAAYSPDIELPPAYNPFGGNERTLNQPEWAASMQEAMAKANARLIEAIKSRRVQSALPAGSM